jgi:hypothetical protein
LVINVLNTSREKSDVWSFGVFVWEIFHLGCAEPYGNINSFQDLIEFLKKGSRLDKPQFCPEMIYDLMLKCWDINPYSR